MPRAYLVPLLLALICAIPSNAQQAPASELTARLQLNSTRYAFLDNGADLGQLADTQGTDIHRVFGANLSESQCADCVAVDDSNHWRIKRAVKDSDLVAVGTVSQQLASLTPKHSFIFTDSEFTLDQIWSSSGKAVGLKAGDSVTVTQAGGTVTVDGHIITASLNNVAQLKTGDRYLLFLKYIPESRSYEAVIPTGFDVSGPTVVPLQSNIATVGRQYLNNLSNFMAAMQSSTRHALKEEQP